MRPRVILTPLQLGLDVQLHHHLSRFLIDTLHQHVRTSDGSDTFHGMGIITIVTPRNKNTNQILRMKVTPKDTAAVGRVPVYYNKEEKVGMTAVITEKGTHHWKDFLTIF